MSAVLSLRRLLGVALSLSFVLDASALAAARRSQPHPASGEPAKASAANAHAQAGTATSMLPPAVSAILRGSGLPAKSFAFEVRAVDERDVPNLLAFNADQPFLLASTTKVVTSLAASTCRPSMPARPHTQRAVMNGRLNGDLVIVGETAYLTVNDCAAGSQRQRRPGTPPATSSLTTSRMYERDPKQLHATCRSVPPTRRRRAYSTRQAPVAVRPAAANAPGTSRRSRRRTRRR
jgi:hypothetical protein